MADRSKDDDALDDWWEDDLLEEPKELLPEDEGLPSAEEDFDEGDDLLADDQDLSAADWDEAALGDPSAAEELTDDDDLLEPEGAAWRDWAHRDWAYEETDDAPEPPPRSTPPPRRSEPASPLSFVAAVRAPEPLVIGYRVPVDLPEHELRGLAGRCHTHRAQSILRAQLIEVGPGGARVTLNGRELRLPSANAEGTAFLARVRIAGRELEVKLSLMSSDAPPRLYLGRDLLAIGHFVVDVTRADS